MLKFLDNLVKSYLKAKDGTIAVAMGVGIVLIVLMVAFGVDTARLTQASSKLKALSDAAALAATEGQNSCLLYTSPSPRDGLLSRMPSSA